MFICLSSQVVYELLNEQGLDWLLSTFLYLIIFFVWVYNSKLKMNFFFLKNMRWYFNFIYLFIYLWLCWVFVSVRGLPLIAASGGHSSSRCAGLSLSRPLLLRSTGSRRAGSVIVAHGPSHSTACGILPDQGSNPCSLHWQADSQPLRHQGSPKNEFFSEPWRHYPHCFLTFSSSDVL